MITRLIWTIWTSLSTVPRKAVKFNNLFPPTKIDFIYLWHHRIARLHKLNTYIYVSNLIQCYWGLSCVTMFCRSTWLTLFQILTSRPRWWRGSPNHSKINVDLKQVCVSAYDYMSSPDDNGLIYMHIFYQERLSLTLINFNPCMGKLVYIPKVWDDISYPISNYNSTMVCSVI